MRLEQAWCSWSTHAYANPMDISLQNNTPISATHSTVVRRDPKNIRPSADEHDRRKHYRK